MNDERYENAHLCYWRAEVGIFMEQCLGLLIQTIANPDGLVSQCSGVTYPDLLNKSADLLTILVPISFDSAANVNSPRANLTDRRSHILHLETSGEQETM